MISYYLDLGYRFLPVVSRNLAARGISPKVLLLSRCPFDLRFALGDGVAHTRMREARNNII